MQAVIFTGLVNIDKNLVGTAQIYQKISEILLSFGYKVNIVVPDSSTSEGPAVYFSWNEKNNYRLIDQSDLIIFGAYPPIAPMQYAWRKNKTIMTYLWSVSPIGSLEFKDFLNLKKQERLHQYITASYNLSLLWSDKIFCRDENIRKLIIGSLLSLGRINLEAYQADKTLNKLIESAPFGLEKLVPKHKKDIYRGQIEGVEVDDFLLIWNGGIWNWNDGETLVRAMDILWKKNKKKIKLIIQGFRHPDKQQKISQEAVKTLALAKRFKIINKNIFFIDQWMPFAERGNYLSECDAGIVTSPDIPEANLFLKTRFYDYLWAGLPVILGDNEAFSEIIRNNNLGMVAKKCSSKDFAEKIIILAEDRKLRQKIKKNIQEIKKDMEWSKTLQPLKNYLQNPQKDIFFSSRNCFLAKESAKANLSIIKKGI